MERPAELDSVYKQRLRVFHVVNDDIVPDVDARWN